MPGPLRVVKRDVIRLHPTLGQVLQRRPTAVDEFRSWTDELVALAGRVSTMCAAHSGIYRGTDLTARIRGAVRQANPLLTRHARKYA